MTLVLTVSWTSVLDLQGTVLDRIDYNIERTSVHVEKGHQQLVTAEKYQKKNRKMIFILILASIVVILIIVLLIRLKKAN